MNQSTCEFCDTNELDDEAHFVLNCPFNMYERNILLSNLKHHNIQNLDFIQLMKSKLKDVNVIFARFIHKSFYKRKCLCI